MKNKMKDSETKSKEWWEVAKEYFIKELEKNLAQHRANERIMKYKFRRRKYRQRNHKTSKVEQLRRRRYNQRYHKTLEEEVRKKITRRNSRIGKGGHSSSTRRTDIQDTTFGHQTTN
jgi:hypothetical protein